MCFVSVISDHYGEKWNQQQWHSPGSLESLGSNTTIYFPSQVTKEEFEALKKEVLEMKALLIRAKEYDRKNNQPDCEMEDKVKILKEVAKLVGVNLNEVFPQDAKTNH